MKAPTAEIFVGFYEPTEVARIVATELKTVGRFKFDSRKVLRWVQAGLLANELKVIPGREILLGFEDLVSMRVVAALRATGVTFPKIRKAESWLREITNHDRPFATEQLWTETNDVFLEFNDHLVAASKAGQLGMDFLRDHLIPVHGLTFNENNIASLWEPRSGILMDPEIQFGQACVKGTRVPTKAIWGMFSAGDPVEDIAEAYWLSLDEVNTAVAWENDLAA